MSPAAKLREELLAKLAAAQMHMHQGRKIVERQNALIRQLREHGSNTMDAEILLIQFMGSQAIFEDECRALEEELRVAETVLARSPV
jgi:hypothetical protein